MKRLTNAFALAVMLSVAAVSASAQDKLTAEVSADVVSSYIWRGQKLGDAAVQPGLSLGYKGFSLGAWGSVPVTNTEDSKEFDLTLSYTTGGLTVGVTDYYISGDGGRYFMYEAHRTLHTFEANVGYDFGILSVNAYVNFAGADGVNKDGDRAYSTYVQVDAPFKLGGLDWNATVGAVPTPTDFYADAHDFAVTNVSLSATKDVKLSNTFSLPVTLAVTANPSADKCYFTAAIHF